MPNPQDHDLLATWLVDDPIRTYEYLAIGRVGKLGNTATDSGMVRQTRHSAADLVCQTLSRLRLTFSGDPVADGSQIFECRSRPSQSRRSGQLFSEGIENLHRFLVVVKIPITLGLCTDLDGLNEQRAIGKGFEFLDAE